MTRKEITEIVLKETKLYAEEMLRQGIEKYQDAVEERITNDVKCQNDYAKRSYPEEGYLAFVFGNGSFIVPYKADSKLTLTFSKDDKKKVITYDIDQNTNIDTISLLKYCKDYEYCKVSTETTKEYELFDEEAFEKEKKVVRCNNQWKQTLQGFYKCSDVSAIYQNLAKSTKLEETVA